MPRYSFGPFELDPEARVLRRDGEAIPTPGKTLDTLILLVENRGRLVDKEELLSRVWAGTVVEEGNLSQTIFTARKILGDSPKDHRYIATIAGRGYQFVAPVIEPAAKGAIAEPKATGRRADSREKSRRFSGRNQLGHFEAAVTVAGVLLAGLLVWREYLSHREAVSPESPRLYRFTSYSGVETMPSFSPDGKQIAYVRAQHDPVGILTGPKQPGQANIYTKLVGAGTELRLTNHPGADYYPAWSPDAQYIAFYRHEPGASGFYIVSALGGHERRITNEAAEVSGIVWLPDGQHLLVSHLFEGSHVSPLMELSLDTGKERPVTSPVRALGDTWPAISPDGRTVAFFRWKDSGSWDVCSASLSVRTPRCWPLQGYFPKGLAWAPSGNGIIFSAIHTGSYQLWRCGLSGNAPVALTSGEYDASLPTTSHESNRLAYVSYRRNVNLWKLDIASSQIVNPEDARSIALSSGTQVDPAFSPDGRKLAFLSDRSGPAEIWVTEMDTESSTQLTHLEGQVGGSPSWSPDGLQIAFDSPQGVYVISADGGLPRRITATGMVPTWSRDGSFIYFASERGGEFQIWKVSAATGETQFHPAIQVTQGGGFRAFESFNGKYLYFTKGRGTSGLWRRNLSDGNEESVLKTIERWGWWALGPDVVYFLESASITPQVRLKALDIEQRSIRDMGLLRYPVVAATVALAASRDGRHVAYTQINSAEADIMLMDVR